MATLDSLKHALQQQTEEAPASLKQPLSDAQYSAGFDILVSSEWKTYQDFIIPQLTPLFTSCLKTRNHLSVLEIGPGPKSVLGYLPRHLRRKVRKYTAFEPNDLFATRLEEWLSSTPESDDPLPGLKGVHTIHRVPFDLQVKEVGGIEMKENDEKYDIILFCHSMYGMKPKDVFIKKALDMLVELPQEGVVVVFHRESLYIDGLVCHKSTSFPTGVVSVPDKDEVLDSFAPLISGFMADAKTQIRWREVCRAMGRREEAQPNCLLFSSPNVMVAFTQHAIGLPELTASVPSVEGDRTVKSWEARLHRPAAIVRPTEVQQVQQCVQWALKHKTSLTVIAGGHSGHCLWPHVVAIDMSSFNQVHVLKKDEIHPNPDLDGDSDSLVIVESGCKTGDIIQETMAANLTVPLGSRPSVGAGLWLQGGIGHLARLHGLSCDAIVGAVFVSVKSSQIICVGQVPSQYWPVGAVRPENEAHLLWAMRGAGSNFGIVISITFKAKPAPIYSVRNWILPLPKDHSEARLKLSSFNISIASKLPRDVSADAYLYWDKDQLHLGMTMIEASASGGSPVVSASIAEFLGGVECKLQSVDGVGLFDTEMYMSGMHGGHGGRKTSSFKRCVFLKRIGTAAIADILIAALETRPTPLCYLHLLHGGGAVSDITADETAFGCRDWDFACVITGVWPRYQDGDEISRAVVGWVYDVVKKLLPLSSGIYGADLGPDPRDSALAAKAFGPNQPRLASLKASEDPHSVLAYACPLLKTSIEQRLQLVLLVTGENGSGKDFCADVFVSFFNQNRRKAQVVSISDATKREYAAATGADLNSLLTNRSSKEKHRPALTEFFQSQIRQRPRLPEEHFLSLVHDAGDVDILLITGMRDQAPVTDFSHLLPGIRLLDVRINASKETRQLRRGISIGDDDDETKDYCPSFVFDNDMTGSEGVKRFAESYLLPFIREDFNLLKHMVRQVSHFPSPGIEFQHVLGIAQEPSGLPLCTSLLQTHFVGDWAKVHAIVSCEAGGFVFAPALASQVDVPLVLIREGGKLPPPTISVAKPSSHISSLISSKSTEKRIEMERDALSKGDSVVVVDDVLSTGETLCAVLQLLAEAGVRLEDITIMVVAEFPIQRGRDLLRQRGFGRVKVQSLLIFSDA